MLLLFLTLVLLGGSANGSQENQNSTKPAEGFNFVISKKGQIISGIRIQIGISGYLSSINGSLQEVTRNTNESIIQVEGSNDNTKCLMHITFRTNQGRKFEFGKIGSNQFKAFPTMEGKVLTSIFGRYESTCILYLEFDWVYPEKPEEQNPKLPTKTTSKKVSG
ncbi:zymogen granule protein 16 homolog B-like [Sarcophilus harrisii]|uniref:zymogen granule protein 16 homolog B-like n=1 Tax=Sarcophilus harrisii TaxID=9305 RepID=UPI001301EC11|nr:zymogen granule protein 16 homolog B-like [Sarcophilus harrisii]